MRTRSPSRTKPFTPIGRDEAVRTFLHMDLDAAVAVAADAEHLKHRTIEVARIARAERGPRRVDLLERDRSRHEATLDLHEDGRTTERDRSLMHARIVT